MIININNEDNKITKWKNLHALINYETNIFLYGLLPNTLNDFINKTNYNNFVDWDNYN